MCSTSNQPLSTNGSGVACVHAVTFVVSVTLRMPGEGGKKPSLRQTKGASKFDDARQTERLEAASGTGSRCGV